MAEVTARITEKFSKNILKFNEKSDRRVYMDLKPEDIRDAVRFIFSELECRFITATGIDTPSGIEILYHFSHDPKGIVISLRVVLPDKKDPHIGSITPIITGAGWIEREMWELLGIHFDGHPDLKHLLLVDDWPEGKFPLRHKHES